MRRGRCQRLPALVWRVVGAGGSEGDDWRVGPARGFPVREAAWPG
jgi:hypothetical protein